MKGIPISELLECGSELELYYKLLLCRYSRTEEEAEEALDLSPDGWQIPYVPTQEFMKSIVLVFNSSLRAEEPIEFINDYWNNQINYPDEYRLSELEYKVIILVVKNEINNCEFSTSLTVLSQQYDFFNKNQTKRSEYMLIKAKEFVKAIQPMTTDYMLASMVNRDAYLIALD